MSAAPAERAPAWLAPAYLVAHIACDAASFVQPVLKLGITPWSPQSGLMLAFLWRAPRSAAWVVAALICAELIVRGLPRQPLALPVQAIAVALIYLAATLKLRQLPLDRSPLKPRTALRFVLVSTLTALVAGIVVVGSYVVAGALGAPQFLGALSRYWVGDLNAMLMLTPLLLLAPRWREGLRRARADALELALLIAATAAAFAVVFVIGNPEDLRFFYLLFVPAIWAALRWETTGLLIAALVVQLGLIVGVQRLPSAAPLVDLQYLMVTLTLTGLALGTVVASRAEAVRLANEREAQQRAIMTAVPDAVLATTDGTTLRSLNPAASRLFDASPGATRSLASVFPALELDGRDGRALVVARAADGREFPAEIAWASHASGADTQTLIIVRDVTERERAQLQLRERDASLARASRAAVAGELATALTHELNQPMTALVTYLRAARILAQGAAAQEPRLQPTLDKAGDEARRAAAILQRLRNFYGGGGPRRERLGARDLVASAIESQRRTAQRGVAEISLVTEDALPDVLVDRVHFEIALFNLLSNAQDALREAAAPRIEVTALRRERQVVVRVEDNGPGIPAEVAGRAFEAFVTTKPDGMGMGLAVSRSLMRAQGGDLTIARGRLGGACFEIRLPVDTDSQELR